MGCKADIDAEPIRFHANASSSIDVMRLDRTLGQSRYVACASSCISMRTSLEEGIKLHRFAGIFPEQFSTEAGRHREAVVAADQRMVIRCFRDDLAHFVHDASHVPPPIQRAGPVDAPFWRHHEGRDLVQHRSMRPRRSLHGAAGGKSASLADHPRHVVAATPPDRVAFLLVPAGPTPQHLGQRVGALSRIDDESYCRPIAGCAVNLIAFVGGDDLEPFWQPFDFPCG